MQKTHIALQSIHLFHTWGKPIKYLNTELSLHLKLFWILTRNPQIVPQIDNESISQMFEMNVQIKGKVPLLLNAMDLVFNL